MNVFFFGECFFFFFCTTKIAKIEKKNPYGDKKPLMVTPDLTRKKIREKFDFFCSEFPKISRIF